MPDTTMSNPSDRGALGWTVPATNPVLDYSIDAWQRSVLFLDMLRRRGNILPRPGGEASAARAHLRVRGLIDGRTLERPGQLRPGAHRPAGGRRRSTDRSGPFIVFDPRAGHGPGSAA